MQHGYVVIDGRYTRYSIMVEIPSHIKTRREAITFLDGYGTAIAEERKQHYAYTLTEVFFDTETERKIKQCGN